MRSRQNLTRSKQCMMQLWLKNRCMILENVLMVHLVGCISVQGACYSRMVLFMVQALLEDAESCRRRMQAASALIGGLGGEKIRWTEQSKQFKSQIDRQCTSCNLRSELKTGICQAFHCEYKIQFQTTDLFKIILLYK